MAGPQRNAGDRFNGSQAKALNVFGQPRLELGRPMDMSQSGPLDSQASQPIPTQGQQGFLGGRQGVASQGAFTPMQGAQPTRLAPRPAAPAPQQSSAELSGEEEAHTIDVHLVDSMGNPLVATYDVIAPRGSRVLGAKERVR